MYVSETYGLPVIDDDNWREHVKPASASGLSESGFVPRDYSAFPLGSLGAQPFPRELLIPRSEWRERIQEKDRKKTWLSDICRRAFQDGVARFLNQSGTNFCWCYAVVQAITALRLWQNLPYRRLSPASAAAPIKGYRNNGGWGTQALKFIAEHGVADEQHWPQNYWKSDKYFESSRENAAEHKIIEWYDLGDRNFDAKVSCVLRNMPVPSGYNWQGHETCTMRILALDGNDRWAIEDLDNYSRSGEYDAVIHSESRGTADDQCSPRVITAA